MTTSVQQPVYAPQDTMYLWWLANPQVPVLIGELRLADRNQRVSLRYDKTWLANGFALSEDLPLIDSEHLPSDKHRAAGAVDDARPDRWGERIIQLIDRPSRLSLLEYLYFAGDQRTGALGVALSSQTYLPRPNGPLPKFASLQVWRIWPRWQAKSRPMKSSLSINGAYCAPVPHWAVPDPSH